jgi:hypothetical protein
MSQNNREAIEAGRAGVQGHIELFKKSHKALKDAANEFRESTVLQYKECKDLVRVLQILRKQTCNCLGFLDGPYTFAYGPLFQTQNQLYRLDGEKTARLILEMDMFARMVMGSSSDESLSKARQRIEMHVSLQDNLKDEVKMVAELLKWLDKLATEEPQQ